LKGDSKAELWAETRVQWRVAHWASKTAGHSEYWRVSRSVEKWGRQ